MKNITAVKWLKTKIEEHGDPEFCTISWKDLDDLINQAKQMEKEQIVKAYSNGSNDRLKNRINDQYYNETFGKQ